MRQPFQMPGIRRILLAPLAIALSSLMLVSCDENNPLTPEPQPRSGGGTGGSSSGCQGQQVTTETLLKGKHSDYTRDHNRVFTNKQQWKAVTQSLDLNKPRPDVDFSQYIVIGAFQGTQPNGGYCIRVQELCAQPNQLTVRVKNQEPESSCAVTQALLNPYHLVKVKRSALPAPVSNLKLPFEETTTQACGPCKMDQ